MDPFTIFLIAAAASIALGLIAHTILTWNKPGKYIGSNAPMDSDDNNSARLRHSTNVHNHGTYGGIGGHGGP